MYTTDTRVSATKKSPTNTRNQYFLADHRKSHDHLLSPRCTPTFRNPPSGNDKLSHTACFNQSHVKLFITWTAFSCCNQSHYELFDDQVEVSRTQHLGCNLPTNQKVSHLMDNQSNQSEIYSFSKLLLFLLAYSILLLY